jgi:hypothetical protein
MTQATDFYVMGLETSILQIIAGFGKKKTSKQIKSDKT